MTHVVTTYLNSRFIPETCHDLAAGDSSLSLSGLLGRSNGHNWLEVIQPNQVFMYGGTFSLHQLMCTETDSEKPRSNGIISLRWRQVSQHPRVQTLSQWSNNEVASNVFSLFLCKLHRVISQCTRSRGNSDFCFCSEARQSHIFL